MRIVQAFRFEAAHRLPHVPPSHRCHRMHGHSYRVELAFDGAVDPATGFVVDFLEVEDVLRPLFAQLDHHCLNDVPGLDNPTAEIIAMWLWGKVKPTIATLSLVTVYETQDCYAVYDGA